MARAAVGVCLTLGLWAGEAAAQIAPRIEDVKLTSLQRAREEWKVKTTICLIAVDQDSTIVDLDVSGPGPARGKLTAIQLGCGEAKQPTDPRAERLYEYEPHVGFTGKDRFQYQATDAEGHKSQIATVEIDVLGQGVRWELSTAGSTGLNSDQHSLGDVASVLGKTTEDFMFVLNWQPLSPRQQRVADGESAAGMRTVRRTPAGPTMKASRMSRSLNIQIETGLQSGPVAAEVVDEDATDDAPGETPAADETPDDDVVDTQRYLTWGSTLNYNMTFNADGVGTFVEVGGLASAHADVFVEDIEALRKSGTRAIELLRDSRGVFRGEVGVRVALKQYQENPSTLVIAGEQVMHPSNLDDLAVAEFVYQRNGAFGGLAPIDGDPMRR